MRTVALRTTASLMSEGVSATHDEADPQLAREAIPGQLKLVESLLVSEPRNRDLRFLAAEGFSAYAFLFLEETEPERAKALYLRGRDHGAALLDAPLPATLEELEPRLAKARKEDARALFWTAFGWSAAINLARDSAEAVADLPKAVAIMRRVHELDKEVQFAGPDLFFGMYYASRPAMLGGDIEKARTHFEWARRLTAGKYLMAYVLEARYLAVGLQDRAMFETLLKRVQEAPAGALPRARLTDEVAKRRAAALLEKADDYF